jgi:hypothetical protein
MKVTAYALIAIGVLLLLFAGVSHLILTPPSGNPPESPPGAPMFSPLYAIVIASISAGAGALLLVFGGRGYSQKTSAAARPSPN